MMMISVGVLALVAMGLIVLNGLNSSQLVQSTGLRRVVFAGSVLAALLAGALIVETLVPADPQERGTLKVEGDEVALGDVGGGVLTVQCHTLERVKKTGGTLDVRLVIKGANGTLKSRTGFQFGAKQSETDPKPENLATNIRLEPLGADTKVKLTGVSPKDKVEVEVAYRPHRFPVHLALLVLAGFAGLAAIFEAVAPASYRRTFLTAALVGVATFVFMVEDGLTTEDTIWSMWIRVAYGIAVGAIGGTFLPTIPGLVLPEMKGETVES